MSGKEGKPAEEGREGRIIEATTLSAINRAKQSIANKQHHEEFNNVNSLQMLKTSENIESERIGKQMGAGDVSGSGKQSGENSEFSDSVRQMTIYSEDEMAANEIDRSVERSSFNTKAQLVLKAADSEKENTTVSSPKRDLLKEKLAFLQRQLDATLSQLATSKTVEPRAALRGSGVFEEAKGGMPTFKPRNLVKGTTLPTDQDLEGRTLVQNVFQGEDVIEGSRMLKDTTVEGGRGDTTVTESNLLQGEPIRYFYFI